MAAAGEAPRQTFCLSNPSMDQKGLAPHVGFRVPEVCSDTPCSEARKRLSLACSVQPKHMLKFFA